MHFRDLVRIQSNDHNKATKTDKGYFVKFKASSRLNYSRKTEDKDGNETTTQYTNLFFSAFVRNKADGTRSSLVNDLLTEGNQFIVDGEITTTKREGKYYTNYEVKDIQYAGEVGTKEGTPAVTTRPVAKPAAATVLVGADDGELEF